MPQRGEEHWKILWREKESPSDETKRDQLPEYELPVVSSLAPETVIDNETVVKASDSVAEIQEADVFKQDVQTTDETDLEKTSPTQDAESSVASRLIQPAKAQLYSELSIVLTIISILVAFAISIIEFMGIALEKCASCAEAAENSNGLDGRWWRFWGACNDSSGYIGAGIVGVMLLCGAVFIGMRKYRRKQIAKQEALAKQETDVTAN